MPKNQPSNLQMDWKDHPYSIDFLQSTLDRIIGFVNSCDVKASIVLGILGIVLAGLLSDKTLENLYFALSSAVKLKGFLSIFYLFSFTISALSVIIGLGFLIYAISAKIEQSGNNSNIYFVDIMLNKNAAAYLQKLKSNTESSVVDDLISQIYINSSICTKKYKRYNLGLKLTTIGVTVFLFSNLIAYNIFVCIGG